MWGINFEDYASVKKKLDVLTNQINKETSNGIKLGINTDEIMKTISDLSKLARQNIQILPDGQIISLSKFNQELGKTISLKKNLTTGQETLSLNVDNDKIRKDTEKMYQGLFKEQESLEKERESQYKALFDQAIANEKNLAIEKQKVRDTDWKEAEVRYKEEQNFINASQSLKQKSAQQSLKQAQEEAKINNQLLESKYKDSESKKQELADAQKLIAYEKQRLEIRLKGIEANRKGLTSESYANKIGDGISNLNGSTTSEVREKVKQLNLELQKLDQNARMKGLQVGNKNIMSFGESIKATATKLGIFVSTAMVLNQVQRSIRDATSYIIELDSAMVNLRKVTDETSQTYERFLGRMHDVALQLGTQSNLMVDATTNWAKTGKNLEEASKLAENTILLTKVGDIDNVNTAQQYMVAPLKAFNIEAEKSITLIDKYNNISNNMATTVQDVGEALNISSSSLSVAGNSLEQSIALISTAESTTKQGGSVIGNALKTISLRLATFKDDETGELIPSLADDLERLGVSAVDSAGQIRSTFDILKDLGKIYKDLDKNTQLKLSEQIGGKRQANITASILNNVQEIDRAYSLATNSAGSAMAEFEKYQQGIQYSLDQLKEQVNGLYASFLNGGFFKGLINGASDVISIMSTINNTFGTFPTVVTTVVGAMTIFNSKFRETTQILLGFNPVLNKVFNGLNSTSDALKKQVEFFMGRISYIKNLSKEYQNVGASSGNLGKELLSLNAKLAMSTVKLIGVKVAVIGLQMAMSMLVSFGISFVIGKVSELVDKLIVTQSELKQLNSDSLTAMKGNQDLISSVEELIKKEEELKNKLSSKGNTYEEQKQYRAELLDVSRQIADILPESANAFDEEGNKIATNTEKILENLDAKKKLAETEAIKAIENNLDYDTRVTAPREYEKMKKQLADMQEAYKNNETYMGSEVDSKWLEKIEKKVNEYESAIKIMASSIDSLRSAGWSEERIAQEIFKDMPQESAVGWYEKLVVVTDRYNESLETVNQNQKEFDDSQNKTESQVKNIESLQKTYEKLGYSVADAKKKVEELNNLSITDRGSQMLSDSTKAYSEAISKTKELESIMKDINEAQSMTPELIMKIADMYPEIGSRILSVAGTQEFLNQKIGESVDSQRNAYMQMITNDSNYYLSKIKNDEGIQENFNRLLSAFVTNSGKAYSTDLSNYNDLNELKSELTAEYGSVVAELITNFVASNADGYDVDLDNTVSWASSKAKILRDLSNQIVKVERQLANHLSNITKATGDGNTLEDEKLYARAKNELANLNTQKEEIMTEFYKYNSGFAGYTPTFVGSDFKGSDSKGGSSSSEKEIKNMEKLSQRYLDLENSLKQVNNELDKNKTLMDNASDEERLKYLDKEIGLLQRQKTAYENIRKERVKELSELKNSLSSSGFGFSGDGSITNANSRLDSLVAYANSLSGDSKENAQSNVEAIFKNLTRYNELLLDQIPEVENQILDLKNTTIDTQKEIVDIIKKQKDAYIDNIEKETDALKKAIQKRRDLRNAEWDEDDYKDELKKRQDTLVDLESQLQDAMRMADGELVKNIKKQIESAQQDINGFIRDNERDKSNDRFDEELDRLDENTQKKIDEINSKLTDEEILKMVQNGVRDLSTVLSDVGNANQNITSTFSSVGSIIQNEWLGNLDKFIAELKGVSALDLNLNANVNRNVSDTRSGRTIGDINLEYKLVVEGGVNEDVLPKVEKMIKKAKDETIREVGDILINTR